jgi:hypothetical protein
MRTPGLLIAAALTLWLGCKADPPPVSSDGGSIDGPGLDASVPGCNWPPGTSECSNCIDDDGDGYIDSLDVECTFPWDNLESAFATGIPSDSIDPVRQDCSFDGNTGAGNDGCDIHVCCLIGARSKAECPIGANQYNPMECPPPLGRTPLSQMCIDVCGPITLPGCDCFGCCTLCDRATNQCQDIATNPNASPGCTLESISDPNLCKACTQVTSCGASDCSGATCILCPGQDPADLAPACNGTPACPAGASSCASGEACPAGSYCHHGSQCCVSTLP